jgi:hypothetical protein
VAVYQLVVNPHHSGSAGLDIAQVYGGGTQITWAHGLNPYFEENGHEDS